MTQEDIFKRLRKIIADQTGKNENDIRMESSLIEDIGLDSLDLVEAVMSIEDTFGIVVSDDEAEKIYTVADAVYLIGRKKKEKTQGAQRSFLH